VKIKTIRKDLFMVRLLGFRSIEVHSIRVE